MHDHEIDGIVRRRLAAIQHMRLALDALACVQVSDLLDEAERGNFSRLYIELARILSGMRSKKPGAGLSAQDSLSQLGPGSGEQVTRPAPRSGNST